MIKKQLPILVLLLTLFFGVWVQVSRIPVAAQEFTPGATPDVSDPTQLPVPPTPEDASQALKSQIEDIKRTYRSHLEQYRNQERQYLIAVEQYHTLGTLTSLDTAVTATRQLMSDRIDVLRSYLTLLRLSLIQQPSVSNDKKAPLLQELDSLILELDTHEKAVEQANDKLKIQGAAKEFEPLGKKIEEVSYGILTQLSVGKLQHVYDQSLSVAQKIKTSEASDSAAVKVAARQRAIAETDRSLESVSQQLSKVKTAVETQQAGQAKSSYSYIVQELSPVFSGLSKSLSFLEELLKI